MSKDQPASCDLESLTMRCIVSIAGGHPALGEARPDDERLPGLRESRAYFLGPHKDSADRRYAADVGHATFLGGYLAVLARP